MLGRALGAGYRFVLYQELAGRRLSTSSAPECLLRHDVDADLSAAATMAHVEQELGIGSTYFLMLRSPLYNLMGRSNHLLAETLLSLGHEIGLHYDQGFDAKRGWTPEQTAEAVDSEAAWLERQLGTRVSAVSFHQPGPAVLQGQITTGSRVNTYDRVRLAAFDYFSDSNRVFPLSPSGAEGIEESIAKHAPRSLQLLIHPIWWVYEEATTNAAWDRAIEANLQAMQRQLVETERAYGPERSFAITTR
jgi:hypothetical protein